MILDEGDMIFPGVEGTVDLCNGGMDGENILDPLADGAE